MKKLLQDFNSAQLGTVVVVLSLLSIWMVMVGIGLRSPWPADEPRFAEVAREMVASGQWLFPTRGGEFYPDKPPVFMWSVAAAYALSDNLNVAFLLPSALCSLLTLAFVFDLARRLWSVRVARDAVLLLLLVPQFLLIAHKGQIDAMLTAWTTVAGYGLIRHFWLGPAWRWYFIGWAFMGLGIITKGVGFLPALMLIPLAAQAYQRRRFRSAWRWRALAGPLALLGVCALWVLPMVWTVYQSDNPLHQLYAENILFKQTGERYVNSWAHIRPWYYFIAEVIPMLWLPLPLLALFYWRTLVATMRRDSRITVLLCWVALVVVFFSLSPGKRNLYIFPALPFACIAIAAALEDADYHRAFERVMGGLLWSLTALLLVLALAAMIELPILLDSAEEYRPILKPFGGLLLALGLLCSAVLLIMRRQAALIRAGVLSFVAWSLGATIGYALFDDLRTPRPIFERVLAETGENAEIGLVDFKEQFILFSPLDVTHFSYLAPVAQQERNGWLWLGEASLRDRWLLVESKTQLHCLALDRGVFVGRAHRRDWYLLGPQAREAQCPAPDKRVAFFTSAPAPLWMK